MTTTDETVTLALWIADYGSRYRSLDAWRACAEKQIEKAAEASATLMLWPEWLSDMWFGFAPPGLDLSQYPWSEEIAESVLPTLAQKAASLGITLVAGTAPATDKKGGGYFNRARAFWPQGADYQDKLLLTPPELRLPGCTNGEALRVFDWNGWRVAIVICLDSEWPHLAARLALSDVDLVLIPSQTSAISGYNRVHKCAQSRAIELYCPVAVVGSAGTSPQPNVTPPVLDPLTNIAGAAVYLPCEKSLSGGSGILSRTEPVSECAEGGILHIVRDVPLGYCRRIRRTGGAEVWSQQQMSRSLKAQDA